MILRASAEMYPRPALWVAGLGKPLFRVLTVHGCMLRRIRLPLSKVGLNYWPSNFSFRNWLLRGSLNIYHFPADREQVDYNSKRSTQ